MDNEKLRQALAELNKRRGDLGVMQPSTTSIASAVELPVYNKKDIERPYNIILSNLANQMDLRSSKIPTYEYNRLATVLEEMQKKYGYPKLRNMRNVEPEVAIINERAHYSPSENYLGIVSRPAQAIRNHFMQTYASRMTPRKELIDYFMGPDIYFQELAHAKQFTEAPIKSLIRGGVDNLLYEDTTDPQTGKYGVKGTLEQEAHDVIAPQLFEEFKNIYTKRYGKFPEQYENKNISDETKAITKLYDENNALANKNTVLNKLSNQLAQKNTTNTNLENKKISDYNLKMADLEKRRLRGNIPDRILYQLLNK